MHGVRFGYRWPWAPHLLRALLAAGLCAAVYLTLGGVYFSGQASATEEDIREVPPLVGFMSGQVEQSADGGATWTAPRTNPGFLDKHFVRTGSDGSCVLVFEDHSLVAIKAGTTIQILPSAPELRLSLLSGKAWVRFDYVFGNVRNGMALPQATMLALGAGSFSFEATRSTSVAKVLEGSATVVPPGGEQQATLPAGQALTVGPSGLQPATPFDVDLERAEWQSLLGQAGLSVTTTTLAGTTTSSYPPPDGRVGVPAGAIVVLVVLGGAAVAVLAILGTFIYLAVNRHHRRQRAGR